MTHINGNKLNAVILASGMTKEAVAHKTQEIARKQGRDFTFRQLDKAIRMGVVHDVENLDDLCGALKCELTDLLENKRRSA